MTGRYDMPNGGADVWDMAQMALRIPGPLGHAPRAVVTTTPKMQALLKQIIAAPSTVVTRARTSDNASNLDASTLAYLREKYGGTRLGRQEMDAELLADLEGALWNRALIDECRVKRGDQPERLRRVVVAVDPPGGASKANAECGSLCGSDERGVQAIFHNTLASSEYGLLDQRNFKPRPNYWAALLWRRLMGPVVLDAGQPHEGLHLYAQCLRGQAGGVALVAINNSRTDTTALSLPKASRRYTLTAMPLQSGIVRLNGPELRFRIKRRQAHLGAILILLVVFTAADATSSREHSVLKYGKSSLPLNEWSSFPKDCSSLAWKIG